MADFQKCKVINPSELDVKKLKLTVPQQNKDNKGTLTNGKKSFISTDQFPGTPSIMFDIRNAVVTYPFKPFKKPEDQTPPNVNDEYKLTITFTKDENGNIVNNKELYNKLKEIEDYLAEYISKRSEDWFLEERSKEMVKANISSSINKSVNKLTKERYPDTFRVRVLVNKQTGDFVPKFYDGVNGNKLIAINVSNTAREIPRGTRCNLNVKLSKLWIVDKKIGLTFDLVSGSFNRPDNDVDVPLPPPCTDSDVGRSRVASVPVGRSGKEPMEVCADEIFGEDDDIEKIMEENVPPPQLMEEEVVKPVPVQEVKKKGKK
jgi:hypothetical protein